MRHHRPLQAALLAALIGASACSDDPEEHAPDTGLDAAEDTGLDTAQDTEDTGDFDTDPDTDTDASDRDTALDAALDAAQDTDQDAAEDATPDDADTGVERTFDPWPTWVEPPACGTATAWPGVLPGPTDPDFDAALATKARQLERQFHAFNTFGVGVNRELRVSLENTEDRALIEEFIRDTDEWDFEAWSGRSPADVITGYAKVAGAYGGVGAAADAFRYATLLREGAECDDIARAREFVVANLDAMHLATAITGVPGVIARGFAHIDQPSSYHEPVPLFDGEGNPLPEQKTNGTWRADNSGLYPDYVWEDSCSRDMLIGWAIGMAATWEVIANDPAFDEALKTRLQDDARAIATSMMTVQESGFDMEVRDADGRMTYHGILHHESIDRAYFRGLENGFNAIMGLGIMGAFAYITQDPAIEAFVYDELIDQRDYLGLILDHLDGLDLGLGSNFSAYNMATQGGWLSQRYLRSPEARAAAHQAVQTSIYDRGASRQPREQKQTFYDFTYAFGFTGESAFTPPAHTLPEDALTAIQNGLETLAEWNEIPYWNFGADNCDETELDTGDCVGVDGTPIEVLPVTGRNGVIIAREPVPMRIRPASNYWWRSNPYGPNGGGDGSGLYPGSDFRFVYWMGRYFQAAP